MKYVYNHNFLTDLAVFVRSNISSGKHNPKRKSSRCPKHVQISSHSALFFDHLCMTSQVFYTTRFAMQEFSTKLTAHGLGN